MAQLFKWIKKLFKRPLKSQLILEFNAEKISTEMEKLAAEIFRNRQDEGTKFIYKLLTYSRNMQIIRGNQGAVTTDKLFHSRGRLEAINDIIVYLDWCFDANAQRERSETIKTTKPLIRREARFSESVL